MHLADDSVVTPKAGISDFKDALKIISGSDPSPASHLQK